MSSSFGGGGTQQLGGVKQTTDFLDKSTWYLGATLIGLILLSNISEGYYQFLKSRERSGNLLSDITNEPVNYPSNVNNGLGYFNTHYPSIRFFDLKELLD